MKSSIQPPATSWASGRLVATACSLALGAIIAVPETRAADKSPAASAAITKTGTKYRADADMQAVLGRVTRAIARGLLVPTCLQLLAT